MQLLEPTLQLVVVEDGQTPDRAGPPTRARRVGGSRPATRWWRGGYRDTIVQGGGQGSRGESAGEAALKIHDSRRRGRHEGTAGGEPREEKQRRTRVGEPEESQGRRTRGEPERRSREELEEKYRGEPRE